MIIREIATDDSYFDTFDYFNDYDDTRRFLVRQNLTDKLETLDAGFQVWLSERNQRHIMYSIDSKPNSTEGDVFYGTLEQFADCFGGPATEETLFSYAEQIEWTNNNHNR